MEITEFFSNVKTPATILHVLSVVAGMGSALISDILFNFYSKDKHLNKTEQKTLEILSKIVWISLVVISLSGIAIFLSDIEKYLASIKFLAKMTILGVLLVNGYLLNSYAWKHLLRPGFFTAKHESFARRISFVGGSISVISWLSVCALGVMDSLPFSYTHIIGLYGLIILVGILGALLLENREFEQASK